MLISDFRIFVRECNQAYNSMKTMCLPFMFYVYGMNIIPYMQTMTTNNRTQNTNGINYN